MIKPETSTSIEGSTTYAEDHFTVKYLFSMLLCQNLNHVAGQKRVSVAKDVTNYILGNTIQFIWHLQLQELTKFSKQKAVSIEILAMMLSMHKHCPELLDRLLPTALRQRTPSFEDRVRKGPQKWKEFFTRHFSTPLNNARELWSDDMRQELTFELASEIQAFATLKQEKAETEARRSRIHSMNSRQDNSTPKGHYTSGEFMSGNNTAFD